MDMSRLASAHQLVRSHAIQARQRLRAEPDICHEGGATGMRLHPVQNLHHLAQPCLGFRARTRHSDIITRFMVNQPEVVRELLAKL